jgi:hypothetical protein
MHCRVEIHSTNIHIYLHEQDGNLCYIVKMYKDKEVNKNVKNMFYQCVT